MNTQRHPANVKSMFPRNGIVLDEPARALPVLL